MKLGNLITVKLFPRQIYMALYSLLSLISHVLTLSSGPLADRYFHAVKFLNKFSPSEMVWGWWELQLWFCATCWW